MGVKSEYTDRPLTEFEKEFAAEPKHYNLLFKFMNDYNLNPEEWYDILILDYLNAVKKYCSRVDLHIYAFSTICYKKLSLAYHHYWRAYYRQKNYPEGGFVSLDYTIQGDNPFSEYQKEDWQEDKKQNTESEVENNLALLEIMKKLTNLQQEILTMLVDEYTNADIKKQLNIKDKAFKSEMEIIRNIATEILF